MVIHTMGGRIRFVFRLLSLPYTDSLWEFLMNYLPIINGNVVLPGGGIYAIWGNHKLGSHRILWTSKFNMRCYL